MLNIITVITALSEMLFLFSNSYKVISNFEDNVLTQIEYFTFKHISSPCVSHIVDPKSVIFQGKANLKPDEQLESTLGWEPNARPPFLAIFSD